MNCIIIKKTYRLPAGFVSAARVAPANHHSYCNNMKMCLVLKVLLFTRLCKILQNYVRLKNMID